MYVTGHGAARMAGAALPRLWSARDARTRRSIDLLRVLAQRERRTLASLSSNLVLESNSRPNGGGTGGNGGVGGVGGGGVGGTGGGSGVANSTTVTNAAGGSGGGGGGGQLTLPRKGQHLLVSMKLFFFCFLFLAGREGEERGRRVCSLPVCSFPMFL